MPNKCTDFSNRKGSPFQKNKLDEIAQDVQYEVNEQKKLQADLIEKVNKKTAEIAASKPVSNDGVFTEVITHGVFATAKPIELNSRKSPKLNSTVVPATKCLLGFPSSANTLALEGKGDLESDPGISQEVKDKVITKMFLLANMVQNVYESKVRIMIDFEKFKDKYLRDEGRREKEHSEQLYKLNINFQNEVVNMVQQLKIDLDASRGVEKNGFEVDVGKHDEFEYNEEVNGETNVKNNDTSKMENNKEEANVEMKVK